MPPKEEKPELTEEERLVMAEAQALKVRGDDDATRGSQRSIAGGPPRFGSRARRMRVMNEFLTSAPPAPVVHPVPQAEEARKAKLEEQRARTRQRMMDEARHHRVNALRIHTHWRQIMRDAKVKELRDEIEILRRVLSYTGPHTTPFAW
jgi:hypothetical protein